MRAAEPLDCSSNGEPLPDFREAVDERIVNRSGFSRGITSFVRSSESILRLFTAYREGCRDNALLRNIESHEEYFLPLPSGRDTKF